MGKQEDERPGGPVGVADVGGSHLHTALVREGVHGPVLHERTRADVDAGDDREALLVALCAPLAAHGASTWVVALPGPFDYAEGRGDFAGVGKFGALAGVDLRAELSGRLGLPAAQVQFLNDAQAYGLGEWFGSPARPRHAVCVTLGTGVGSAFLVDGEPVERGPGVPPHGWVHLLQIHGRPLEDTVSTRAVVRAYATRSGRELDVKAIAAAARLGDRTAADVLAVAMRALGAALRPCLTTFGADELVVGGSVSRSWDLLEEPLREGLLDGPGGALPPPAVRASALLDDAPLLGAAWWFSRRARAGYPSRTP